VECNVLEVRIEEAIASSPTSNRSITAIDDSNDAGKGGKAGTKGGKAGAKGGK